MSNETKSAGWEIPGFRGKSVERLVKASAMDAAEPGSGRYPDLGPLRGYLEAHVGRKYPATTQEDREDIALHALSVVCRAARGLREPEAFASYALNTCTNCAKVHFAKMMTVAKGKAPFGAVAGWNSDAGERNLARIPLARFLVSFEHRPGGNETGTVEETLGGGVDPATLCGARFDDIMDCVRRHTTKREFAAFECCILDDLSSKEAAAVIGSTSDGVRCLLTRVRARLRKALVKEGLGPPSWLAQRVS